MKRHSLLLVASAVLLPSPGFAQLVSQRPDGQRRVCVYASATNVISARVQRQYRVGLAQNCPMTPPPATSAIVPPTAQLTSERVAGETRECVYEQSGMRWTAGLPANRQCPLARGMIRDEAANRTRRDR